MVAYINALRARDGSLPDTVYIGRHDEFPHIELPANMEHASVRIIAPSEAEVLKQGEHFRYLNIFGTLTPGKAEFFVVSPMAVAARASGIHMFSRSTFS